jgi:hypothetical protein
MASFYDELRTIPLEQISEGMLVPTQLRRVTLVADIPADSVTETVTLIDCHAALGDTKIETRNDVEIKVSEMTLTAKPRIGDRITLGVNTHTVLSVEETNPDGGIPIVWKAVVE